MAMRLCSAVGEEGGCSVLLFQLPPLTVVRESGIYCVVSVSEESQRRLGV